MLSAESLGHIANLLFGAAYLVRGILWLRILSIVACVIMAFFNYFAPAEPLWVAIYWNVSFTLVNLIQVWLLLRERGAVSFTEEEKELYQTMFRQMSPVEFMKILRIAHWNTLDAGEAIIRRGSAVSQLSLIYHGSVRVSIDDEHQVDLKDGAFLGEMAFVSGGTASGDVTTAIPTRILSWRFDDLRSLFRRNPEIRATFHSLINTDLASKLIPKPQG